MPRGGSLGTAIAAAAAILAGCAAGKMSPSDGGAKDGRDVPQPPPDECDPPCLDGQRCDHWSCVCDSISCQHGCCTFDGRCFPGDTSAACGNMGGACVDCHGRPCATGGVCDDCTPVCGGKKCGDSDGCGSTCMPNSGCTVTCSPSSCKDGCCSNTGVCRPGSDAAECGSGGNACASCMGRPCVSGACQGCVPSCVGKPCGADPGDGCGNACGPGSGCTMMCNAMSCANGCCNGNTCTPPSAAKCGKFGVGCRGCGPNATCNADGNCECVSGYQDCDGDLNRLGSDGCEVLGPKCPCKSDSECPTPAAACRLPLCASGMCGEKNAMNDTPCTVAGNPMGKCRDGACVVPSTCDASCPGCCDAAGKCQMGGLADNTMCGKGGAACTPCASHQACVDGACGGACSAASPCRLSCCSIPAGASAGTCESGSSGTACGPDATVCTDCLGLDGSGPFVHLCDTMSGTCKTVCELAACSAAVGDCCTPGKCCTRDNVCVDGAGAPGRCTIACSAGNPCTDPDKPSCCAGVCTAPDAAHCGVDCKTCSPGQRCAGGACVCDSTSCPSGCCDSTGQCRSDGATDNMACGKGGASCAPCDADQACVDGACGSACSAASPCRLSCCSMPSGASAGTCKPGNGVSACGNGGTVCMDCYALDGAGPYVHTCDSASLTCKTVCETGACGQASGFCCPAGQCCTRDNVCVDGAGAPGACLGPCSDTSPCGEASTPACCGGTCTAEDAAHCGAACFDCTQGGMIPDATCTGGLCSCTIWYDCPSNQTCCMGTCHSLDNLHCDSDCEDCTAAGQVCKLDCPGVRACCHAP